MAAAPAAHPWPPRGAGLVALSTPMAARGLPRYSVSDWKRETIVPVADSGERGPLCSCCPAAGAGQLGLAGATAGSDLASCCTRLQGTDIGGAPAL